MSYSIKLSGSSSRDVIEQFNEENDFNFFDIRSYRTFPPRDRENIDYYNDNDNDNNYHEESHLRYDYSYTSNQTGLNELVEISEPQAPSGLPEPVQIRSHICFDDEFDCPICLETVYPSMGTDITKVAATTGCGHTFCKQCIYNWLETHKSCPMCRTPISS